MARPPEQDSPILSYDCIIRYMVTCWVCGTGQDFDRRGIAGHPPQTPAIQERGWHVVDGKPICPRHETGLQAWTQKG